MPSTPSSLTDKVRTFALDGATAAAAFLRGTCVFISEAGAALFPATDSTLALHDGVVLCAAGDGQRLVTGGDDGKVREVLATGEAKTIATQKGRWIDRIALGPDGSVAYSAGKSAFLVPAKGEVRSFAAPSTVGGLAFAPKGLRVAVAHYGGVSLWYPNAADAKPEVLEWKGSHLGVTYSPDGRFIITTMQEPSLHGWRLADGAHMRMTGYPARVKSFEFTHDGKWLASSGSTEVVLWPFATKDGPIGKQPSMQAPSASGGRVTVVACHPKDPVMACGYDDGMVLMVRLTDGAEILLRAPDASPVSAIAWRKDGGAVAFGTAGGSAGLLEF
ncbi:WD40 repeat domain-containing protein [Roseixanthobacter glucoisosaccharinicivorans]|uniref:WD40 repeat domain-containing protein n=1 Tax=Roseixanthobacter glucoisosaccharinicivorans TaxID=3119923 RepID=UPI003727AD4D